MGAQRTQECEECTTTSRPFGTRMIIKIAILEVICKQTGITTYDNLLTNYGPDIIHSFPRAAADGDKHVLFVWFYFKHESMNHQFDDSQKYYRTMSS